MRRLLSYSLSTLVVVMALSAGAEPIELEIVGVGRGLASTGDVPDGILDDLRDLGLVDGAEIRVRIMFDSEARDSRPDTDRFGEYRDAILSATANVGSLTWTLQPLSNIIVVSRANDLYRFDLALEAPGSPMPDAQFDVRVFVPEGGVPDDSLPTGELGPILDNLGGLLGFFDAGLVGFDVDLTRVGPPVPEPPLSLLLGGLVLLLAGWTRWARR